MQVLWKYKVGRIIAVTDLDKQTLRRLGLLMRNAVPIRDILKKSIF